MSTVLKFKVESFRKIPNPYTAEIGDNAPQMYIAICDVKNLPDSIPMETNPREQKLTTAVPKKIQNSLVNEVSFGDFYLLNRGLCISAASVEFNNYSNELTLVFEDLDVHGDVDGGHTYKVILENRDKLEPRTQFVKLELLEHVENCFQRLAAARNTSTQVKDQSIAELENRFEIVKKGIQGAPYEGNIYFEENGEGDIDVTDILAILNLFNIDDYPEKDTPPIVSYSGKRRCTTAYINYHKMYGDSLDNPYVKMLPIMKDFFDLYDTIERNMGKFYKEKTPGGQYGKTKGVSVVKQGADPFKSKFNNKDMDYQTPTGFIYPILGAFRALIEKNADGYYKWRKDPFKVLEKLGGELVFTTVDRSRSLGNNPQSVGKDRGHWVTLYMLVRMSLID